MIFHTCTEFCHGVNIGAAVLIDKGIDRKLVDISAQVIKPSKCQFIGQRKFYPSPPQVSLKILKVPPGKSVAKE